MRTERLAFSFKFPQADYVPFRALADLMVDSVVGMIASGQFDYIPASYLEQWPVLVAANEIRQMENGIFAGTLTPSMFDAAEARPALQFVRKD